MADAPLTVLTAVLLGVLQGLTEWLPVSSSGHLVLAQALFGIEAPLFFDLVLHVGTLLVVVVFFRRAILDIVRSLYTIPSAYSREGSWRAVLWDDRHRRLALLVVLGSVPTAIMGFLLEARITGAFDSPLAVGVALLVTGTFLWSTRFARLRSDGDVGWREALAIGAVQGLALFPGVSRSGSTIGSALLLGVDRERAVQYSFLLSIPAIGGATLLHATEAAVAEAVLNLPAYAAGTLAAMVVGYVTLFLLVALVRRQLFHWFAFYCWATGAAVLAWALLSGT